MILSKKIDIQIIPTRLPPKSEITKSFDKTDYQESFRASTTNRHISTGYAFYDFFSDAPLWVKAMFTTRNFICRTIRYPTPSLPELSKDLTGFIPEVGHSLGIFKIIIKKENEIIFGNEDTYMQFSNSIYIHRLEPETTFVTVSTVVRYNKWKGRIFFMLITPFHRMIVKTLLKRMIVRNNQNSL